MMNISKICLAAGLLWLFPFDARAQISPDGSTSTTVNNNGNISTIEAGNQDGTNLFHSFESFSIPNGNEAFFNNAADIENIFSRVTGGNISNIDGLIRANNANLFLINPAGIIFGNGARLDIGGAFYGGSAESILFPGNVEFNANDTTEPILTINAPIGLNFRDQPAPVSVQSPNLTVVGGQELNLFGGEINFENATLNALGGNVNLSAISNAGTAAFNQNLDLDFSNLSLGDISLNNSQINVNGAGSGIIEVNSRNLSLADNSAFSAGINSDSSTSETQAGNVIINATETVALTSGSIIRNNVSEISSGNAGDILITANNLSLADDSRLSTISFGNGNTGSMELNIAGNTALSGASEIKSEISDGASGTANNIQINSAAISLTDNSKLLADVKGNGDGGDIIINASTLELKEQSDFSTNLSGQGTAGNIGLEISDSILLEGSTFQTTVLESADGNAGDINIKTNSLVLSNDGANSSVSSRILASTSGTGDAGDINITAADNVLVDQDSSIQTQVESTGVGNAGNIFIETANLALTNGTKPSRSSLLANSEGQGDGGDIILNVAESFTLNGFGLILSQGTGGTGDAGDIQITADTLSLSTGSVIASTTGDPENLDVANSGNAGNIEINTRITTLDEFSGISSSSISNAISGQAGNITVNTDSLTVAGGSGISALTENASNGGTIAINATDFSLQTGGVITTLTNGVGDAGDINLKIEQQFEIDGANPLIPPEEFRSPLEVERQLEPFTGLFANTTDISTGNGGSIQIITPQNVSIFNGGTVTVDSEGTGNGGNLLINANSLELNNQSKLIAETQEGQPEQEPSNIILQLENILSLAGDSQISAQAFNNANGGNVTIGAEFVIAFSPGLEGNDIIANAREGAGGRIDITAQEIFGLQEGNSEAENGSNDLNVSSELGFDGNISINTPDVSAKSVIRDLPVNAINPGENVQQACSAQNVTNTSSLSLEGRGGIPSPPVNTLSSDNILFEGEFSEANSISSPENNSAQLASPSADSTPIVTAQGNIYPARGVLVNEQGEIILTASANQRDRISLENGNKQCLNQGQKS